MQIEQEKETREVKVVKVKLSTFVIVIAILVITLATLGILAKSHFELQRSVNQSAFQKNNNN